MAAKEETAARSSLPQPRYKKLSTAWKWFRKGMGIVTILTVTLTIAAFIRLEIGHEGKPLQVTWKELHGLQVGSDLKLDGGEVARVRSREWTPDGWKVTFEVFSKASWHDRLLGRADHSMWETISREGSEFRIVQFAASLPTGIEGASTPIHGPYATVIPGKGAIRESGEFTGIEVRPLEGISRYSPQKKVFWTDLQGLEYGRFANFQGTPVGRVTALERGQHEINGRLTSGWWVDISFFDEIISPDSPILTSLGEYYLNYTDSDGLNVKNPAGLVNGTTVEIRVAPGEPEPVDFIVGRDSPPDSRITPESPRKYVFWTDLHGLKQGRYATYQGAPVAQVTALDEGEQLINGRTRKGWWVEFSFFNSLSDNSLVFTSLAEFYLNYTDNEGLRVFNPTGLVNGTTVEIRIGPGEPETVTHVTGKTTLPPDSHVSSDSPRITVNFLAAYNVKNLAYVVDNKTEAQVGQVLGRGRTFIDSDGQRKVPVHIALFDADTAYEREQAEWYVVRARTDRDSLSLEGSETYFTGEKVAVIPGDPTGKKLVTFTGRWEPRPHREVDWDDLRIRVDCRDAKQIELGAPFIGEGRRVGEVEAVENSPRAFHARLTVVLFHYKARKPDDCPYALEKTRFFPTALEADFQGIAGDLRTLVQGTYLVAVPDPYYEEQDAKSDLTFVAENRSAPKVLPREGEQQLRLRTREISVEPDTLVIVRGTLCGYVHSVDNTYMYVRLFPNAQSRLYKNSRWFVPEVMKTQVLRRNSWTNWEGPKVDFNPDALRQKYIEFRTPSEERGERCDLSKSTWTFTLQPKPEDEWLEWGW
jgi:hypothetical protein